MQQLDYQRSYAQREVVIKSTNLNPRNELSEMGPIKKTQMENCFSFFHIQWHTQMQLI